MFKTLIAIYTSEIEGLTVVLPITAQTMQRNCESMDEVSCLKSDFVFVSIKRVVVITSF